MPTRLLRTDRIANIVDFGAIENSLAAAATNAQAFRDALTSGARRIAIPGGIWYFREISFGGNNWLPFGTEIFGQGVQDQTTLRYRPTVDTIPAFQFAPGISRSTIRDLWLEGRLANVMNTGPVGTGISLDNSLFNRVRDVYVTDFNVGIQLNAGAGGTYSAHNVIERFEVNLCRTGIDIGDNSNANLIQGGRIWSCRVLSDEPPPANEVGFGIDVHGTQASSGPVGAQALVIDSVTIENCVVGLRVQSSRDIAVLGCYFEPDAPEAGTTRRRALDIDALTTDLTFVGTRFSEAPVPAGEENWTPTYIAMPPEGRGLVDASTAPVSGNSYTVTAYGGGLSGTTAAHANRIRNADMSRGTMFWSNSLPAPIVTPNQTPFVTGGASTRLQVVQSTTEHIFQDFVIDSGLRTVTVCVRYRLLSMGAHAFRFDLWDPVSSSRLGFFSDVGPGPTSEWRVRSLTGRFDGLAGGVVGPRQLRVRIFPFNAQNSQPQGQQVLIDSVWLVDGEYASPYRPYTEGIELPVGDDRQVFFGGTTTAPVGPTAAGPTLVPSNAIGMVVEMLVQGAAATTTTTILRVNDLSGTLTTRDVHAFVNGRPTIIEYTLPFSAGTPPQWSVVGAAVANAVTYSVRLKQWILRL